MTAGLRRLAGLLSIALLATTFTTAAASATVARPVTLAQLESAPVPSLCGHPAGRLVHGVLPGIPAAAGNVVLAATAAHHGSNVLAVGDLNGDGVADAAAVVLCRTGSSSRPASVQLYTSGGKRLGGLSLDAYTHRGTDVVAKLSIVGGAVVVHWSVNQRGDAACCPSLDYATQLRLHGTRLVVSHTTSYGDHRAVDYLAAYGRRGDTKAALTLATPAVARQVIAAQKAGRLGASYKCFGSPVRDKTWRTGTLSDLGDIVSTPAWLNTTDRYCVSLTIAPPLWTVVRLRHVGWHRYQADKFVQVHALH